MRIAISGLTACGNSTASELVAKSLGFKKYNYTFHDLARDLHIPFEKLHSQAEENEKFDLMLDEKQIEFSLENENCVVGTRLAVFLDSIASRLKMKKPSFDLKVWLEAPQSVRAERLAKREKKSLQEALKEVSYRDKSNRMRYKKLYSIDYKVPKDCLVVDTSKFSAQEAAEQIIAAL